ncbi:hypothetical protein yc1106_09814 [Curvularia clavata]|uniref:Autophagy-related protein 29 n=1 Tax=Curvularia clavata TaxID=95742 RepID=A0A9Q9DY18_CURCL|nr:hypothetical protein yc1106_09814 [Curvularia clavata]
MSSVQFTALIRLPFIRGDFEDPPQAQWDAEKDRQLWKVISKSSKTSDLNWVELADKFQVPPTFLLQQAAWLYERHLDHVRNQMKKVSITNANPSPSPTGGSTMTAVGGVAMRRGGSAGSGAGRTTSALAGRPKESPSFRGGEVVTPAPSLSRTPSTTTITQSRAHAQTPGRTLSTRSTQRPNLTSRKSEERAQASNQPSYRNDEDASPEIPDSSSSSSSSLSDTGHPVHRSQLFKRPPRFQQKRPRDLSTFEEGDGTQEFDDSGSHETSLPFASAARTQPSSSKFTRDAQSHADTKPQKQIPQPHRSRNDPPSRQKSIDVQSLTTETASSMTSSGGPPSVAKSPMSPNFDHRAALGRLGSPRRTGPRSRKEGSEGTPSMGSSFSDIDDAGISQSALEEALLSNMQHGRMSTLSRMSKCLGTNLPPLTTTFQTLLLPNHGSHLSVLTRIAAMAQTPPLPMVIISDCNSAPEISVSYQSFGNPRWQHENIIHLSTTYKHIKSLLTYPRCTHPSFKHSLLVAWPCESCVSTFAPKFWDAAKLFLDYFADFFAKDTEAMHAVWFHMVDLWQESAHWYGYRELDKILEEGGNQKNHWMHDVRHIFKHASDKMDAFLSTFKDILELIQQVTWGLRGTVGSHDTQDVELYDPMGEQLSPLQIVYQMGPWISGVKPWAQFLFNGGPGVIPPEPRPPLETGKAKLAEGEEIISKHYLPLGAIGVLFVHTQRDRELYDAHYRSIDEENIVEHHHIFDRYSAVFPRPNAPTHSFMSPVLESKDEPSPRRITYTLGNGTPPIVRHPTDRYADEEMQAIHPDMNLVDEAVAMCLAIDSYEPHGVVNEGPEEDLDDNDTSRVFDMWTVIETRGGEESQEKGRVGMKEVFVLGEMFDNFCTVGDVANCLKE